MYNSEILKGKNAQNVVPRVDILLNLQSAKEGIVILVGGLQKIKNDHYNLVKYIVCFVDCQTCLLKYIFYQYVKIMQYG